MKIKKLVFFIITMGLMVSCGNSEIELEKSEVSEIPIEEKQDTNSENYDISINLKVIDGMPEGIDIIENINRDDVVLSSETENKKWVIDFENNEDFDLEDIVIEYSISTYGYSTYLFDKVNEDVEELKKKEIKFNEVYQDVINIDTLLSKEKISSDVFYIGGFPYTEIEITSLTINGINQGYNIEGDKNYNSLNADYSSKEYTDIQELERYGDLSLQLINVDGNNDLDIKINIANSRYRLWDEDVMAFLGDKLIIGEGFVYKPDNRKWNISAQNKGDVVQDNVEITYTIKAYKNELEFGIDRADIVSNQLVLYAEHTDVWKIDNIDVENEYASTVYKDIFYMWTFPYVEVEINSVIVNGVEQNYTDTKASYRFEEFYHMEDSPHFRRLLGV